jgi:hypothetical protein
MRPSFFLTLIPAFLLLASLSCHRDQRFVGEYRAAPLGAGAPLTLLLNADGKGSWTIAGEDVPFSWESKGDELVLHSKSGGVLAGKFTENSSIDITLPGVGRLQFEKVRE